MSSEVFVATAATLNRGFEKIPEDHSQGAGDSPVMAGPPIEFFTENGFCIVRLADVSSAALDSMSECHFLVRDPRGTERQVDVSFAETIIAQLQSQKHNPLSDRSLFWPTLAERQLATYLWSHNDSPADGRLVISCLSGVDLTLAARWID
jgi:hypothetical protein